MQNNLLAFFPNLHWYSFIILPGLLVAFTIHELGHSISAYFLGDTSQIKSGHLTANPLKHISWLGTILFVLFGVGWPKPLQFDSKNFKDRYLDSLLVALAGPAANLAVSVIIFLASLILLTLLQTTGKIDAHQFSSIIFFNRNSDLASMPSQQAMQDSIVWIVTFTNRVWVANFAIALISLIPLPPFDGFTAILSLMGIISKQRVSQLKEDETQTEAEPQPTFSDILIMEETPPANKKHSIAEIHFQKGLEYHQDKKFNDAIARYRLALQNDSSFGPAYINMGLAYKAKGQEKDAIHAFRGATQYAGDEKSQNQAWSELHNLGAIPNLPPSTTHNKNANGAIPWTDTRPTPNWARLAVGLLTMILAFTCPILLLLISVIQR